jgi:hypothetical protein
VVGEFEVSEGVLEPPCFADVFEQGFVAFGCERRVRRDRDPLLRV